MKCWALVLALSGVTHAGVMTFSNNSAIVVADVSGQNITPSSVRTSSVTITSLPANSVVTTGAGGALTAVSTFSFIGGMVSAPGQAAVKAWSGGQSIPNSTLTEIYFGNNTFDTQSIHNVASSSSTFTIPASGLYFVQCGLQFAASATGVVQARVTVNGTYKMISNVQNTVTNTPSPLLAGILSLSAADVLKCQGFQSSGGALNVNGGEGESNFSLIKVW